MQNRKKPHCPPSTGKTLGILLSTPLLVTVLISATTQTARAQGCPSRCHSCLNGVVNCTGRSLIAPPRRYPPDTRVLNLKDNYIRILGSRSFKRLRSLEILKVNNNKINSLRHHAFRCFPNVATVDLSENRIYRINVTTFENMTSLRTLLMNRNRINNLTGIFHSVPNLYQLNLAKNRIPRLGPRDLAGLTRVSYLDLRNNRITRIHPRAFDNMSRLRYLFLEGNPLNRRLPNLNFGSNVLQLVDFSKCRLPSVPKTFPSSLSDYRLGHNRIMQVNFTDFSDISDLQLLALNDNELHFFADGSLTHLQGLQEVWLRRNSLVYIPRDLPDNLRRLHIDSNSIQEIEAGLFSADSRLEYLSVESNQIHRLQPNTFTGMSHLGTLNFQGNAMQVLEPDSFRDLPALRVVLLSNNPLQRIENGAFHNLPSLTSLYMSFISQESFQIDYNFLMQMPTLSSLELMASPAVAEAFVGMLDSLSTSAMFVLPSVTSVDLSFNTLEYLSFNVRAVFPNLQLLPLDGNPFRCTRRLQWLRDWMVDSDITFHKIEEPMCDSPPHLYGRPIRSLLDHEWGMDNVDRNSEMRSAHIVNEHAALMARDMPGPEKSPRTSQHRESAANYHEVERADDNISNRRPVASRKNNGGVDAIAPRRPNLLEERVNREERRKKKLRSKGKRRGKGRDRKKGKRRGKGKGRGRGGKRRRRKNGNKQRVKRDTIWDDEIYEIY